MSAGTAGAGAGAVVRQGHLRKLKTMKKKYFVLRAETADCSARLEYYESEKKFRAGAAPRRVLPLKGCYNITRRLDLKQKHVIALFTREEQFCIVAENEQELHAWLTAIVKQHRSDDASEELLHPTQHVWQVNVQKKGLGSSKNIQGLYNLCLTDKTLSLVKIKSQNNVISDLGIPEKIEYSLKNIRRCGDSECFFYMEVGRQTSTGAGELWMHSDDSNIAQSMHSTIYLAMRNCAKETENERDHIILPGDGSAALPPRRQTYSDARGRAGLTNAAGMCVGSCIRQCVCASAAYSLDAAAPDAASTHAENQPPNNSISSDKAGAGAGRVIKHHRTVSLPTGCGAAREAREAHERTRSAPLAGDERAAPWPRRASTGARLSKLSPAHKNAGPLRSRCDSMPSRACSSFEVDRPAPRHTDLEGLAVSRDETDALAEWYRTPRIPEEPDVCDVTRDFISSGGRVGGPISSVQHSRTSSMGTEDAIPDGYLPMAPGHEPLATLVAASSGSVCSGTPSTDPRFSEYQLEPATSHIVEGERPPRAWSVGSRAAVGVGVGMSVGEGRHRAYSVGARCRPAPAAPRAPASAPLLPRASAEDLMELDFSANCSPQPKVIVARTPPTAGFEPRPRANTDEYVDMSPRIAAAGFPAPPPAPPPPAAPPHAAPHATLHATPPAHAAHPAPPDGYVEMNYTRAPSRPIAIAARAAAAPAPAASPPRRLAAASNTPLGSQTIFPISLESPASPPDADDTDVFDEHAKEWRWSKARAPARPGSRSALSSRSDAASLGSQTIFSLSPDSRAGSADSKIDDAKESPPAHPLSTVREISEEGARLGPDCAASCSPQYVRLHAGNRPAEPALAAEACSTATVVVAGGCLPPARFNAAPGPAAGAGAGAGAGAVGAVPGAGALQYAALDLQPRRASQPPPPRTYTQIDFLRSEKLHADAT